MAAWFRGLAPRMHFYRDSDGNEVDLLLEHGAAPPACCGSCCASIGPAAEPRVRKLKG